MRLWEALRNSYTDISDICILATDMSPEYLDRAKTAVYPRSSKREAIDYQIILRRSHGFLHCPTRHKLNQRS